MSNNLEMLNQLYDTVLNLDNVYSKWAKKYNITKNELCTLNVLLKNKDKDITQKQISESIGITFTTLNSVMKNLCSKKYIVFNVNQKNHKEKYLALTEKGIAYAESIVNPLMDIEQKTADKLKSEDILNAIKCLEDYKDSLLEFITK